MERFNYQKIPIDTMSSQINIRMPDKLLTAARDYADSHGYGTVQEFIKETVRERLFDDLDRVTPEEARLLEILEEESERQGYRSRKELFAALKN